MYKVCVFSFHSKNVDQVAIEKYLNAMIDVETSHIVGQSQSESDGVLTFIVIVHVRT